MNVTLTQAKEIIGITTLSDVELEKYTNQFFKWVTEMTESYKEQYISYIKAREDAFKYEPQMYGDNGSYNGRDTNNEGEPE